MKKRLIAAILATAIMQVPAYAAPDFNDNLDRNFSADRTMYYMEVDGDTIPDISIDGYKIVKKAEELYVEGGALTTKNVTVLENIADGTKYRFAFYKNGTNVEIKDITVSANGMLTITGKTNQKSELKVFILKPTGNLSSTSYKWDDVNEAGMEECVLDSFDITMMPGDEKILEYIFPESAISGAYGILIDTEDLEETYFKGDVFYAAQADFDKALDELNQLCKNADSDDNYTAIVNNLSANSSLYYIDTAYFDQLTTAKNNVAKYLKRDSGYTNPTDLGNAFIQAVAVAWANEARSSSEMIEKYSGQLGLDLYTEYEKLNEKALITNALGKAESIEEYKQIFNQQTVVEMINEAKAPGDIDNAITTYKSHLNLSQQAYSKYTSEKNTVLRALQGNSFKDKDELERKIINTDTSDNNGSGGNGGGSNGGGSSRPGSSSGGGYISPVTGNDKEPASEMISSVSFPFIDCDNHEWAKNAIDHMYKNKIISGKTETEFYPADKLKREEFVKIIVNSFELTEAKETAFEDVVKGEWYEEFINTAFTAGIVTGVSETEFGTGRYITREDLATMLYRAIKNTGFTMDIERDGEEIPQLADLDEVSDYAKEAVQYLVENGAINGSDGYFKPKDYATRAEAVKMIYQIIKIR